MLLDPLIPCLSPPAPCWLLLLGVWIVATSQVEDRWASMWKPGRPYASNDLSSGVFQTSRERALGMKYVEVNPPAISNLLVVDIDHPDALMRAVWDRQGWRPNALVENPVNGHAHAVWALQTPFPRTEYARRKPLAWAASITEGLRRSVEGDAGYSGLITKNPLHESWDAHTFSDQSYSFEELTEHLTDAGFMPAPSWRRSKQRNTTGLGRNCHLFESVRTWAYPQINDCWGDPHKLGERVLNQALVQNVELFPEPLPSNEVQALASSITRWITTRSRMWADGKAASDKRFSDRQRHRSSAENQKRAEAAQRAIVSVTGGEDRQLTIAETAEAAGVHVDTVKKYTSRPRGEYLSAAEERRQRIRALAAEGMSYRQIAAEVGCGVATVSRALK